MANLGQKEITPMVEGLAAGQHLVFMLSPTFGGQHVVIETNPKFGEKKQKRFLVRLGKDLNLALTSTPLFDTDKAKKAAAWVAERSPQLLEAPQPAALAV